METPRPTSSVYSRDEDGVPFSPSVRTSAPENDASRQLQSVIAVVNRLLWADGFQAEILEAIHLLERMRTLLHDGITEEILQEVDSLSKRVTNILTAWTRRNQRISVDARLMRMANVSAVSQRDPNTRIQPLPTMLGCEVNVEAARGVQGFFVKYRTSLCNSAQDAGREYAYSTYADIRGTNYFDTTRDRLEDVVFMAEQARKDVAASWEAISERSMSLASHANRLSNESGKGKQRDRKFTFKSLFSKRNSKRNDVGKDESEHQAKIDSPANSP